MKIDKFINLFIEEYMLGDLEGMAKIVIPVGKTYGGAGYPIVSTVLTGMELLGELLMPNEEEFNPKLGNDYFLNYWDNYFAKRHPEYTGLGRAFRQLMRNGISHVFVAKPGIYVEKGTGRHISVDLPNKEISIDAIVFYKHFENTFEILVKPIVISNPTTAQTTKKRMQKRLNNLIERYSQDSDRIFASIPPLDPATHAGSRDAAPIENILRNIDVGSGVTGMPASAARQNTQGTATITATHNHGTATVANSSEQES